MVLEKQQMSGFGHTCIIEINISQPMVQNLPPSKSNMGFPKALFWAITVFNIYKLFLNKVFQHSLTYHFANDTSISCVYR